MNDEIITGIHSISHALLNPKRSHMKLFLGNSGVGELDRSKKELGFSVDNLEVDRVGDSALQDQASKEFKKRDFTYQRVPSNMFLISQQLEQKHAGQLYGGIEEGAYKKMLCLDQITDVHNIGAIFRTASFYGVDAIVLSRKGEFRLPPSFFRISSGAREYIDLIKVPNLSRTLTKVAELGTYCLGFSEHESSSSGEAKGPTCLVMGSEDKGLSNAVQRCLENFVCLEAKGSIKSLNVSVAAAIGMEKFF